MPAAASLAEILEQRVAERPNDLAFADADGGRALSFADLAEQAALRAAALRHAGVRPGDRVAVAMTAGTTLVEVFWGLQLLGAAPCVLNPSVPAPTLERRAAMIRPRLVVTDELVAEMAPQPAESRAADSGPEDVAFLQLTSGSSGEPRASVLLHRQVLAYLAASRIGESLGRDDVLVSWVPPWHDLGLLRFVVSPVFLGSACHIVQPSAWTIPEWLRTISRVGGTYSAAPDFAFRVAARIVDPATVDLSCMRLMTSGGEPVRWSTVESFGTRFGILDRMAAGYGLGEATLEVAAHRPGEEIAVDERGTVSCGFANPGIELRAGSSMDEPAEITVRGEQVFSGYFGAPEETSRALRDGWLHTGDTGYLDPQGRLFVLGRRAGMIKRAGSVISPRELEEAASRVPEVRQAGAVSLSATGHEDEIVAIAVQCRLSRAQDPAEICAAVAAEVRAVVGFAPGYVQVVRRLPQTDNGKIRHGAIRELLSEGYEARRNGAPKGSSSTSG
jgi:fatty-acyl-CoA synthase